MEAVATTRRSCALVVACLLATAGCSGDDSKPGNNTMTTPDASKPVVDSGTMSGDDSSVTPPGDDASTAMDASKGGKKDIGSPCTATTDCRPGLMCDPSFPMGMCTEACTMDTDCLANSHSGGACIGSTCYATCVLTDAGTVSTDDAGAEAGAPKAPCKNKAFACMAVANETSMVCLPTDAGTSGDDGGGDDGGGDASGGDDSSTAETGPSEAGASDATTE